MSSSSPQQERHEGLGARPDRDVDRVPLPDPGDEVERLEAVEGELERLRALDAQLASENEQTTSLLRAAEDAHAQKLAAIADGESNIEAARADLLKHTAVSERLR